MSSTASDGSNLGPQPQPKPTVVRDVNEIMKEELEANRARLSLTRKTMSEMKEQIKKCILVLKRELGKDVDIPTLVRTQSGNGYLGRSQEIINLRLRLSALKSQFVEPVHKFYYRGPFDPRKKFDVDMIPKKQDSLYSQLLEEDKELRLLKQDKPVDTLREQMRELSLMYRASCAREKSLKVKVKETKMRLDMIKAETRNRVKVIEYMIGHQSLMKLMLDPATISLDGSLSDVKTECCKRGVCLKEPVPTQYKFKTLYDQREKEVTECQEMLLSLTEKLDSNIEQLVRAEELCIQSRCEYERLESAAAPAAADNKKAAKGKPQVATEEVVVDKSSEALALVKEGNRHVRDLLLSPMLLNREDYSMFLRVLDAAKTDFLSAIEDIKRSYCPLNEETF